MRVGSSPNCKPSPWCLACILCLGLLLHACGEEDIGIAATEVREAHFLKVSKSGSVVRVVRNYVVGYDLEVVLAPCGANGLVQVNRLTYVPNATEGVADTDAGGPTYHSYTDWIGPYWITAANDGNANSGFTGGWHGYDGGFGGSPTARTSKVSTYVDSQFQLGDCRNVVCEDVKVMVENYLQAGNTKQEDGTGREVLRETVTYHFHADTLSVAVTAEALEDLTIDNYYGLQGCFDGTVRMFTEDSVYTFRTDGYRGAMSRVYAAECTRDDGHRVLCLLDDEGLGTQDRYNVCTVDLDRQYCFTSPQGKIYFRLVGEAGLPLAKGETVHWSGAYIFSEKLR